MGLLSFLGPALNVATQAAGAYQGAQAKAQEGQQSNILRTVQLKRQQEEDALKSALTNAQIGNYQSEREMRDYKMAHPDPVAPVLGSPEWLKAQEARAKIDAQYSYHPPRNIDPLSPEGIAAQIQLAQGKPPTGRASIPTSGERAGAAQAQMAESALADVDRLSPSIVQKQVGAIPGIGNTILGATDDNYQSYQQAAQQFITSYIYAVSGKAVTDKEYTRLYDALIPQPGDNPQTLSNKSRSRQEAVQAMRTVGGRAVHDRPTAAPAPGAPSIKQRYGLE